MNRLDMILSSSHYMDEIMDNIELMDEQRNELLRLEEDQMGLFVLFQIDLENYLKVKFALMYHMQIPPEQIDQFPFWEYEMYTEQLAEVLKKKQEAEKGNSNTQQSSMDPQREASKFMRNVKMPNMPKIK